MSEPEPAGAVGFVRGNRFTLAGAIVVIVVDQIAKAVARHDLPEGSARQFLPSIDLVRTKNTGVSFGLLNGAPGWVVGLVSTVALLAVLALLYNMVPGRVGRIAAALIVGGAIGNLIDRVALGGVTDFLDLPLLPPCNLADVAITFGAITMAAGLLFSWTAERQQTAGGKA
jgi:signal peptidase II